MRLISGLSLLLLASMVPAADAAPAPVPTVRNGLPGYVLSWQDEFDGAAVNTTRWSYRTDPSIWSAQQRQNVAVADGNLVIHLRKEAVAGKEYTGGGVITKATSSRGFYEARLRIPAGAGWHTSFRLSAPTTADASGATPSLREISVCENDAITGNRSSVVLGIMAGQRFNVGGKTVVTEGLATEFHTFGVEVTERLVIFYRDGEVQQSVDLEHLNLKDGRTVAVVPGDYRIWLSCVAANLGGTTAVDEVALPATLQVDYLRYFTKP